MKVKKFLILFLVLFLGFLFLWNTGQAGTKKLQINSPKDKSLYIGQTKIIHANQKASWSTLNKRIKIVSKKADTKVTIRAVKEGSATLIAKKGKQKACIKIKVKKKTAKNTTIDSLVNNGFSKITSVNGNKITVLTEKNKTMTINIPNNTLIWKNQTVINATDIRVNDYIMCAQELYYLNTKAFTNSILIIKTSEQLNATETTCLGQYYIHSISETEIGLSRGVNTEIVAYASIKNTSILRMNKKDITFASLAVGQKIIIEYTYIQETYPAIINDCKSIVVVK